MKQNKYGKKKHSENEEILGTSNCVRLWRAGNCHRAKTQGRLSFVVPIGHTDVHRSVPLRRKYQNNTPRGDLRSNEIPAVFYKKKRTIISLVEIVTTKSTWFAGNLASNQRPAK